MRDACRAIMATLVEATDECVGERPRSWERAREKLSSVPPVSIEHASAVVCSLGPSRALGVAAGDGADCVALARRREQRFGRAMPDPNTPSGARTNNDGKPHGSGRDRENGGHQPMTTNRSQRVSPLPRLSPSCVCRLVERSPRRNLQIAGDLGSLGVPLDPRNWGG